MSRKISSRVVSMICRLPTTQPVFITEMRSQRSNTWARLWLIMTTVCPWWHLLHQLAPCAFPPRRARGRLVEDDDARVEVDRAGDADALALAAGERAHLLAQVGDADLQAPEAARLLRSCGAGP